MTDTSQESSQVKPLAGEITIHQKPSYSVVKFILQNPGTVSLEVSYEQHLPMDVSPSQVTFASQYHGESWSVDRGRLSFLETIDPESTIQTAYGMKGIDVADIQQLITDGTMSLFDGTGRRIGRITQLDPSVIEATRSANDEEYEGETKESTRDKTGSEQPTDDTTGNDSEVEEADTATAESADAAERTPLEESGWMFGDELAADEGWMETDDTAFETDASTDDAIADQGEEFDAGWESLIQSTDADVTESTGADATELTEDDIADSQASTEQKRDSPVSADGKGRSETTDGASRTHEMLGEQAEGASGPDIEGGWNDGATGIDGDETLETASNASTDTTDVQFGAEGFEVSGESTEITQEDFVTIRPNNTASTDEQRDRRESNDGQSDASPSKTTTQSENGEHTRMNPTTGERIAPKQRNRDEPPSEREREESECEESECEESECEESKCEERESEDNAADSVGAVSDEKADVAESDGKQRQHDSEGSNHPEPTIIEPEDIDWSEDAGTLGQPSAREEETPLREGKRDLPASRSEYAMVDVLDVISSPEEFEWKDLNGAGRDTRGGIIGWVRSLLGSTS